MCDRADGSDQWDQNRENSRVGSGLSELGLARLGVFGRLCGTGRRNGRSLVQVVAVFLDVLLKLRAEGLENEETDEAGSGDLAGASTEDLGDRVDDHHEGDEDEDDDEHNDAAEGFHCSDCLSFWTKPITRVRGYRFEVGSQFWGFL